MYRVSAKKREEKERRAQAGIGRKRAGFGGGCDMGRQITEERVELFRKRLYEDEKKEATVQKYVRDLEKLKNFLGAEEVSKEKLIQYKKYLEDSGEYKTSSINSFLAAANYFCESMGWPECRVKTLKVQEEAFRPENKELTWEEYNRMVEAGMKRGNPRLTLLIQTLASTGIRISELRFITVESLEEGAAVIHNKGKVRRVLYPSDLLKLLKEYVEGKQLVSGAIFCTKSGKAVDRSNVWREMKSLCQEAGVDESKVFPHNLRHLFAKCFYRIKKDLAKLADVLGHSSIETTRIYIRTTGKEHKKQLDMMNMVIGSPLWGKERGECTA